MTKPNWRPYTHGIDGWGLRAESEAYRATVRLSLAGDWELAIVDLNGKIVSNGFGFASITDALHAAEQAWEAVHHVL